MTIAHTSMGRRVRTLAAVAAGTGLAIALSGQPAAAQGRKHCGEITTNEIWREAESPHIVDCDIVVRNSTLQIQPGTQVVMNPGTNIVVRAGAALQAPGNPQARDTVQILPNDREVTPGFWGQIRFEAGGGESVLNDVSIRGGGQGGKPMVEIRSPVTLDQMNFQFAAASPLAIDANVVGASLSVVGPSPNACTRMTFSRNGVDAVKVQIDEADISDIRDSQNWYNLCVPYVMDKTLRIGGPDAPTLTLNQGVTMKFGPGAGLVAGVDAANPGHLDVSGGPEDGKAAVLTGLTPTPGAWTGVDLTEFVDPNGLGHSFINARVEYGGQGGRAMVRILTPLVIGIDSVFAHAAGYPVEIRPDAVDGFVAGLTSGGNPAFVANGIQRILVAAGVDDVDLPASATWKDPGSPGAPVPFEIDGDLKVAGRAGSATLQLQPGVALAVRDGGEIIVGDAAGRRTGGIDVRGATDAPVTLSSVSDRPGTWKGLTLTDAAAPVRIAGLHLQNGGQGGRPMLDWGKATGVMTTSTLSGAAGYPIGINLSAVAGVIGPEQRDERLRNAFSGNGTQRIMVRIDGAYGEKLATWSDPGVPVEFADSAVIAKSTGMALGLTAGLHLVFPAGKFLQIGDRNARAVVTVEGERSETAVVFRALDAGGAGWGGIRVLRGASLDARQMEVRETADDAADVTVDGGVITLRDGWRLAGKERGIGVDATGADARVDLVGGSIAGHRIGIRTREGARLDVSQTTIAGNSQWGILNEDPALCQLAKLVYWGAPGGPTDPSDADEGCMNTDWAGGGDKVSDHVNWWPYATNGTTYPPATGLGPNAARIFVPWTLNNATVVSRSWRRPAPPTGG